MQILTGQLLVELKKCSNVLVYIELQYLVNEDYFDTNYIALFTEYKLLLYFKVSERFKKSKSVRKYKNFQSKLSIIIEFSWIYTYGGESNNYRLFHCHFFREVTDKEICNITHYFPQKL